MAAPKDLILDPDRMPELFGSTGFYVRARYPDAHDGYRNVDITELSLASLVEWLLRFDQRDLFTLIAALCGHERADVKNALDAIGGEV